MLSPLIDTKTFIATARTEQHILTQAVFNHLDRQCAAGDRLALSSEEGGSYSSPRHERLSIIRTAFAVTLFRWLDRIPHQQTNFSIISSRITGPGELFASDSRGCAHSPCWAVHSSGSVSCSAAAPQLATRKQALRLGATSGGDWFCPSRSKSLN